MTSRIVLVTGGANGIGWAACRRFAAAGDSVVVADIDGAAAKRRADELGAGHLGVAADVSVEADVVAMIGACVARFGRLDVLVNNAGVIDARATPLIDQSLADFQHLVGINVRGAYMAAREAGRQMLGQGGGTIVNLASGAGIAAVPYRNAYGATKAAVASLTRTLACEWAQKGIRVNAVAPGYTRTELVQALIDNGKVDTAQADRRIPMGRMADSAEIAEAIFYLASPGSSYVTGALLAADGGFLAYGGTGAAATAPAPRTVSPERRVVVVTGAGSGIGAAICQAFAALGDHVVLYDRNAEAAAKVAETLPGDHLAVGGDVVDETAIEAMVEAAVARWGRVDVLINNAGVAEHFAPTLDQKTDEFQRVMDVDLAGVFAVSKAVGKRLLAQQSGAVVNLASIAGIGALPPRNAYCAAKAGVLMLTRSMACEWAPFGVRVNAVAPGYIETPGLMALERTGLKGRFDKVRRRTPMGRFGQPSEIADAAVFLCSDAASYVTGSCLSVDGGWAAFGDSGDASQPD